MLLLSCNCPCACATTHKFQQQKQQLYIGIIIIKRWIIPKIWNNFCRWICMLLLLLLCNFLVLHLLLWMHNGRWTIRKTTWTVATITTDRNQHKLLSVGELRFEIHVRSDAPLCCCCCCYCFILLSWNCHCACATTDESQQQYYTVKTIIKQLMITKIFNKYM